MFYGKAEHNGFTCHVFMEEKVKEILLPSKKKVKPEGTRSTKADDLARKVNRWVFEGTPFNTDYDLWGTPFQRKVCDITRKIPEGFVMTYGDVARHAGSYAPRAVGNTMARNPLPLLLPCHRVVASDLTLHNYGGGLWMKRRLLEQEGVKFFGDKVASECVRRVV